MLTSDEHQQHRPSGTYHTASQSIFCDQELLNTVTGKRIDPAGTPGLAAPASEGSEKIVDYYNLQRSGLQRGWSDARMSRKM